MVLLFVMLIFVPWGGNAEHRAKRTLPLEVHNYAGINQGLSYSDNFGSYFSNGLQNMYPNYQPLALSSAPEPLLMKFYDQATKTNVTSKPMLFEYQPTSSSVIHATQSVQPGNSFNQPLFDPIAQLQLQTQMTPHTNIFRNAPSGTAILPMQHGKQATLAYENNGQVYPNVKHHSLPNNPQAVSGKYLYLNGKVIFDSNQVPYPQQNMNQGQTNTAFLLPTQQSQQYYQHQQKIKKPPIIDDVNRSHIPRQKVPHGNISPMANKVTSIKKKPLESINDSLKVPLKKSGKSEPADKDNISTKDNDDFKIDSEPDVDYLKEHENNPVFGKYSFDYEESEENDRDHAEVEDDDDEEDNERDYSKYASQKTLSNTGKTNTDDYANKYIDSESKYDHSKMKFTKSSKKPSMFYKSIKSSSDMDNPKIDSLEGRYSEDLPVTHKHKIFRGKWYISKNTDV